MYARFFVRYKPNILLVNAWTLYTSTLSTNVNDLPMFSCINLNTGGSIQEKGCYDDRISFSSTVYLLHASFSRSTFFTVSLPLVSFKLYEWLHSLTSEFSLSSFILITWVFFSCLILYKICNCIIFLLVYNWEKYK